MSRQRKHAAERVNAKKQRSQSKSDARKPAQEKKWKEAMTDAALEQGIVSPAQITPPYNTSSSNVIDFKSYGDNLDMFGEQIDEDEEEAKPLSRSEARKLIEEQCGPIAFPIRFVQAPLPVNPIKDSDVHEVEGAPIWLIDYYEKQRGTGKRIKKKAMVRQESNGAITCSCRKWMRKKNRDCAHTAKIKRMLGISTAFAEARRRGPTYIFFPKGEPCEDTRLQHHRIAMPKVLPDLIETYCQLFIEEPEHEKSGAIGITEKVQTYALLIKASEGFSREQLQGWLREHMDALYRLGWNKDVPPHYSALSRRYGTQDGVARHLEVIAARAAATGRKLDTGLLGDSFDTPNVQCQNSRDRKFGPPPPSFRSNRPLLRTHFLEGDISGMIYAFDISQTVGDGAGDSPHLPSLLIRGKKAVPHANWAALDQGYPSYRNFEWAGNLGFDLYIRTKDNESRLNGEWPAEAERMARMEDEEREKFDERMRMRPKTERTPKRLKDFAPIIRLRRRKRDPQIEFPEYEGKLGEQSDELIEVIHRLADQDVGIARGKDCKSVVAVANLRSIIRWSFLLRQSIDPSNDGTFSAIITIRAQDLLPKAA